MFLLLEAVQQGIEVPDGSTMTMEQMLMMAVCILAGIVIIFMGLTIFLLVKTIILNKKYKAFMKGSDGAELESTILNRFKEIDVLKKEEKMTAEKLDVTCETLIGAFQKIGIIKYDAFSEMGGKLSYSLCLLNDLDNGFIITSIRSRDGSNSYIKEIIRGESYVILSKEERKALEAAQRGLTFKETET